MAAAESGGGADSRTLEQTATWAVAIVCLGFVLVSILIEQSIHLVAKWLKKRHKKALSEALEKIKAELMVLGFISLLLTVGQKPISEICVSQGVGDSLLPCSKEKAEADDYKTKLSLSLIIPSRILAGAEESGPGYCGKQGKVPIISQGSLHQLHIFVFALAVFHVLSCIITMLLGQAKMNKWKAWEEETKTLDYEFSNDPARFRFTRETTFGRRHMNFWSTTPIFMWIVCFFRQFLMSVPKVDYLTLRHGFILAHFSPHSRFNFQKYIKRSLEDDFNVVVSISPTLWLFAVLYLLVNGHGWSIYLLLSFVPLIILLIVGTKLQVIITTMALQIQDTNPVVQGTPVVKPNDRLFWFGRPRWILYLIHFTLFQNAFQFAFFFWSWYEYGLKSCFHGTTAEIISRLGVGSVVQILCSYVTLPLYALVTQMGTNMRKSIFDERVAESLKRWHHGAKRNLRHNKRNSGATNDNLSNASGNTTPIEGSSPIHLLHKYKNELVEVQMYQSEYEVSDNEMEMETPSPSNHTRSEHLDNPHAQDVEANGSEFSFARTRNQTK